VNSVVIQQLAQSSVQAPGTGSIWEMTGVIAAAGALGGIVNAILNSGSGYNIQLPRRGTNDVLQLGIFGNVLLGIVAALISWGLYGPVKDAVMLGSVPSGQLPVNLTMTAAVGAIVTGIGGARVISNELDKKVLRNAGTGAAQVPADANLAVAMATLSPVKVLAAANDALAAKKAADASPPSSDAAGTPGGPGSPGVSGAPEAPAAPAPSEPVPAGAPV
jgi:hypothetical protein